MLILILAGNTQHHIDFIYNKMLSYRRETALQGALQFMAKVED